MKKIFFVLLLGVVGFAPLAVSAAPLPYFGGFDVATVPCTCTPGIFWHYFTPLYFSFAPSPTIFGAPLVPFFTGAFAAPPVVGFSTYVPRPTTWALGTYVPGVQACWVGVPPFCFPLPNYGLISPETGVSPTI